MRPFSTRSGDVALAGESVGEGRQIVLLHGLTATRRYVVHGSRVLERRGLEVIAYDARGHGESDPGRPGTYGYHDLLADLEAVLADRDGEARPVLAGSSMGAHTLVAYALRRPERLAGIVVIGPSYAGALPDPERQRRWGELADGLERAGVEGFLEAYERGLDPAWRDTLVRIARERLGAHRHPEAVAEAIREVSRSRPFAALAELEALPVPALVVASRDDADPGHPYAVAEAYAETLPDARLVVEGEGESPLAWQGGRLSREIAAFCASERVSERRPRR